MAGPRSDGAGKIAVFIAEGDARVRHGIRSIIEAFPNFELVGEAASPQAALGLVERAPIGVAIVDLEPSTAAEGLQVVTEFNLRGWSVVAMSTQNGLGPAAFAAGAADFVAKDERGAAGLVESMRAVARKANPSPDQHDSP